MAPSLISEVADVESISTADRKFLIAPRLIPSGIAAEAVFRIIDAIFEGIDGGFQSTARFEVDTADFDGAWAFVVSEKLRGGRRDDTFVMLCGDVVYDGQMGGVMERDAFLAIVDVEVVSDDMFAEDEAIAEALCGDAAQRVVVVLIARHHEADGVAGIGLQLFTKKCVADVVVQAELRIRHMGARDILQIDGTLRGIHTVVVEMDAELQIGD